MLTSVEIQRIINAQKEIFYTREEMDQKFSSLQTSVDRIAKDNLQKNQELLAVTHKLRNIHDWVEQAAPKIGIEFKR